MISFNTLLMLPPTEAKAIVIEEIDKEKSYDKPNKSVLRQWAKRLIRVEEAEYEITGEHSDKKPPCQADNRCKNNPQYGRWEHDDEWEYS